MDYNQTLQHLYSRLPMFSRVGAAAYKPGLDTSLALDAHFGHPHRRFRSIHIAGTNGKGSVSNLVAATLQAQGYKVGLYTSPHLVDFRERMRVNGQMIPKQDVVDFTQRFLDSDYQGNPSFFELTMMMAFDYFAREEVDYAVIEVGMGGRLDSTNIITPIATAITNISFDHTQFLGSTLAAIAGEKAGIIKPGIPVVIGETTPETRPVFADKAATVGAPIIFAENMPAATDFERDGLVGGWRFLFEDHRYTCALGGDYQRANINTALTLLRTLRSIGVEIDDEVITRGFADVEKLTGFAGRWTVLDTEPLTICDTGHNKAGLTSNMNRLAELRSEKSGELNMVMGFVADKDIAAILSLLPRDAHYYVCNADIPRALPAEELALAMRQAGLEVTAVIPRVADAYAEAKTHTDSSGILYVGGSTFVVADLLASLRQ